MTRLSIVPIVEGHGEDASVPLLLRRLCGEFLGGEYPHVLRPIRVKRHKITREHELERAIKFALAKFHYSEPISSSRLILILLDADEDAPCIFGPQLLKTAKTVRPDVDIACVLANVEYETWFVAAAESLDVYLDLSSTTVPDNPEQTRSAKAWVRSRFRGPRYSETQDQPRLTEKMDLALCRSRSRSFDKLCRELERRLSASAAIQ